MNQCSKLTGTSIVEIPAKVFHGLNASSSLIIENNNVLKSFENQAFQGLIPPIEL